MLYPDMFAVRQAFSRAGETDVSAAVQRELQKVLAANRIKPGARIAIAVGSRGIRNLALMVRTLVKSLKDHGAHPFIFPAMGSHGGGTPEGQAKVLQHYGISEDMMGCPIVSEMETVQIGRSAGGFPVFLDRNASRADHVIALNRVKSHTEFKGEVESGIMKIMLIGMGKQEGARYYHKAFSDHGFDHLVESLAQVVIDRAKILCALAVVENAHGDTALVQALLPKDIVASERSLLRRAKELAPKLPFDEIDVLIVDEMGKNISGSGMDTNVLGRFYNFVAKEPLRPRIKRIYVRDLTPESGGNATGIGLADFAHRALVDKADLRITAINCVTAGNPEKARIPIVCQSDREALNFCFDTIGLTEPADARVVRIRNTLRLAAVDISRALAIEAGQRPDLEIVAGPSPLEPDGSGSLGPMLAETD